MRIRGLANAALQLTASFLTVAVFLLLRGGLFFPVPARDWPWLLLLGFVNTGVGCWLYFSSIGALSVQTVAVCGYLEPLSAVLFSVLLLGEPVTFPRAAGAVLILGGAALGELGVLRKKFAADDPAPR